MSGPCSQTTAPVTIWLNIYITINVHKHADPGMQPERERCGIYSRWIRRYRYTRSIKQGNQSNQSKQPKTSYSRVSLPIHARPMAPAPGAFKNGGCGTKTDQTCHTLYMKFVSTPTDQTGVRVRPPAGLRTRSPGTRESSYRSIKRMSELMP